MWHWWIPSLPPRVHGSQIYFVKFAKCVKMMATWTWSMRNYENTCKYRKSWFRNTGKTSQIMLHLHLPIKGRTLGYRNFTILCCEVRLSIEASMLCQMQFNWVLANVFLKNCKACKAQSAKHALFQLVSLYSIFNFSQLHPLPPWFLEMVVKSCIFYKLYLYLTSTSSCYRYAMLCPFLPFTHNIRTSWSSHGSSEVHLCIRHERHQTHNSSTFWHLSLLPIHCLISSKVVRPHQCYNGSQRVKHKLSGFMTVEFIHILYIFIPTSLHESSWARVASVAALAYQPQKEKS